MAGFGPSLIASPKPTTTTPDPASFGTSAGQSSSQPYAPEYIGQAGQTLQDLVASGHTTHDEAMGRLMDYIASLRNYQGLLRQQAKGVAARGAQGQQNPLAVYQAVNEMSNQAGIPMDAQISQALLQGNNIDAALNDILAKTAQTYTQIASIPRSQSTSSSSGGGVMSMGGNNGKNGQGNNRQDQGIYIDIYGNKYASGTQPGYQGISGVLAEQKATQEKRNAEAAAAKTGASSSAGSDQQTSQGFPGFQSNINWNQGGPSSFSYDPKAPNNGFNYNPNVPPQNNNFFDNSLGIKNQSSGFDDYLNNPNFSMFGNQASSQPSQSGPYQPNYSGEEDNWSSPFSGFNSSAMDYNQPRDPNIGTGFNNQFEQGGWSNPVQSGYGASYDNTWY